MFDLKSYLPYISPPIYSLPHDLPHDLPTWLPQLSSINEVLLIEHLSTLSRFFELRDVARDIAYDFFRSRWASLLST